MVAPEGQVGKGQQVDDASDRVDTAATAMAHSDRRFDLDYSPMSSLRLKFIFNSHLICPLQIGISHVYLNGNVFLHGNCLLGIQAWESEESE